MKKVLSLVLVAMVVLAVSCGKKGTPESVAKSFLENLSQKKYDEAKKYATAESATMLDQLKANPPTTEMKVEVKEAVVDGDKATVNYTENGEAKVLNLVKENDEWKVKYEKEMPPMDLGTDDATDSLETETPAEVK